MAKELGHNRVRLELDSTVVVHVLTVMGAMGNIVREIKSLTQGGYEVRISDTLREGDKCADKLSELSMVYEPWV